MSPRPLTPWDRLVFGGLTALAGSVIGLVIALALMLFLDGYSFNAWVLAFSVLYFFGIGWLRGATAGEFAGEAVAVSASAVAAVGDAPLDPTTSAKTGTAPSLWLWVVYLIGMLLVAVL